MYEHNLLPWASLIFPPEAESHKAGRTSELPPCHSSTTQSYPIEKSCRWWRESTSWELDNWICFNGSSFWRSPTRSRRGSSISRGVQVRLFSQFCEKSIETGESHIPVDVHDWCISFESWSRDYCVSGYRVQYVWNEGFDRRVIWDVEGTGDIYGELLVWLKDLGRTGLLSRWCRIF